MKEELKDVSEGGLLYVDRMELGKEVVTAWPDTIYEIHKYGAGNYGIPVVKGGQQAVLKLSAQRASARLRLCLTDYGWLPWKAPKTVQPALEG